MNAHNKHLLKLVFVLAFGTALVVPTIVYGQAQLNYQPLVGIPGLSESQLNFNAYINQLYFLSISIAALLAVIKIIIGGVKWMLTDIVTSKSDAKNDIRSALVGLVLIVSAVLILETINPQLRNLNVLEGAPALIIPASTSNTAQQQAQRVQEIVDGQLAPNYITPTSTATGGGSAPSVPTSVSGSTVYAAIRNEIPSNYTIEFVVIVPTDTAQISVERVAAETRCNGVGGSLGDIRVREGSGESQYYFCAKAS